METRVKMHHMRRQKKDKGQFYQMLSLDFEKLKILKGLIGGNNHVKFQKSSSYTALN